jgi:hypothetical protein
VRYVIRLMPWLGLALLAVPLLIGLAYLIGRLTWRLLEPNDESPGGRTQPPDLGAPGAYGPPEVPGMPRGGGGRRRKS